MRQSALPVSESSLGEIDSTGLFRLRAAVEKELRRRGLAVTVGDAAEVQAISFYNSTPGLPNLSPADTGTKNVDALSRLGERYSIKGVLRSRKTGTVYPDQDPDRQLFEYLLVVMLDEDWGLKGIYEFSWDAFLRARSWDRRMNAWYLGTGTRKLATARIVFLDEGT